MTHPAIRSRWVMAGHVRTHYSESGGNGPVVVLLHGQTPGSTGEAWFAPIMPSLGEHFQVYAPDSVGGFGQTDPTFRAVEGAQSRVDHLHDFIEALCLDRFHLVGASQGGWVAAKYAVEHPERLASVVLADSQTLLEAMGIWTHSGGSTWDGKPETLRRILERQIVHPEAITDELVNMRTAAANLPGVEQARQIYQQGQERLSHDPNLRLKYDLSYTLPRLSIPAMAIWGNQDASAPLEVVRKLDDMLPNIPFHFIDQSGHQMAYDQPRLMIDMLTDFFRSA